LKSRSYNQKIPYAETSIERDSFFYFESQSFIVKVEVLDKMILEGSINKFVRTKMRLKLGTKIALSERFVRFVRFICQILFSSDSMSFPRDFRDLKKRETDGPTDHGRTDPLIEMRRRI